MKKQQARQRTNNGNTSKGVTTEPKARPRNRGSSSSSSSSSSSKKDGLDVVKTFLSVFAALTLVLTASAMVGWLLAPSPPPTKAAPSGTGSSAPKRAVVSDAVAYSLEKNRNTRDDVVAGMGIGAARAGAGAAGAGAGAAAAAARGGGGASVADNVAGSDKDGEDSSKSKSKSKSNSNSQYWKSYAVHRQRTTATVLEGADRDGFDMSQFEHPGWGTLDADAAKAFAGGESTLCVLGAGNSNDLDLAAFASRFKGGVLLLDVDEVALKHGLELQADALSAVSLRPTPSNSNSNGNSDSNGNVVKIGVAEFTGVLNTFPNRPPRESSAEKEMATLKAAMDAKHLHTEFGTHNTVLSSCILSQFNIVGKIWGKSRSKKVKALGSQVVLLMRVALNTPIYADVCTKIYDAITPSKDQHIRQMIDLLEPGGLGVLVVDFVSEESLPGLLPVPANNDNNDDNTDEKTALETLTWKALRGNNFLTGCNPVAIMISLQKNINVVTASVKVSSPWRWHLGEKRVFLVVAITFVKKTEEHMAK